MRAACLLESPVCSAVEASRALRTSLPLISYHARILRDAGMLTTVALVQRRGAVQHRYEPTKCEGSVWYGALQPRLHSGATIDVFKSWAERRRHDPRHILLERRFKHPVISRAAIKAARALRPLQGRAGLYFSGVYTTGFDSQESAIYSAMKVAEALAPRSPPLTSLKRRLASRGLSRISYDP
jgi:predicted NAD/FAD-binding protein